MSLENGWTARKNKEPNKEECVCDIYAMLLLFEFMHTHTDKNINYHMIECYMISIINIVVMDSFK